MQPIPRTSFLAVATTLLALLGARPTPAPAPGTPGERFAPDEARFEVEFAEPGALDRFVRSGGDWWIEGGELHGTDARDPGVNWITYGRRFESLSEVVLEVRILPPSANEVRLWVGPVNAILNWQLANENHFRTGRHSTTVTRPGVLTPGRLHRIRLTQEDERVVIRVDGRLVHETRARLAGTVSLETAEGNCIALRRLELVGVPSAPGPVFAPVVHVP